MKDDVGPAPEAVPKKRRQLEAAPDLWVAQWLARDDLTPSERRRIEEVKASRKTRSTDVRVGVIVGQEGVTREQADTLVGVVIALGATEIHQPRLPSRVYQMLKRVAPVVLHEERIARFQEIIKASDAIVVCPNGESGRIWEQVKYAKHRRLPVRVVMPDGKETS